MMQRTILNSRACSGAAFAVAVAMALAPGCATGPAAVGTTAATKPAATKTTENGVLVTMETSAGTMVLELYPDAAPYTVENFLRYARAGFYNGTIFHRVVKDYLIQGGGFYPSMAKKNEGIRDPVPLEAHDGLANMRGTIAMARETAPDTATSQFFVNVTDNAGKLDHIDRKNLGYAVFGKVVRGMDVVDGIADSKVAAHSNYGGGKLPVVPVEPIVIRSVRLLQPADFDNVQRLVRIKEQERLKREALAQKTTKQWLSEYIENAEAKHGKKFHLASDGWRYMDLAIGRGPAPLPSGSVLFQYKGTLVTGREFENNIGLDNPPWYPLAKLVPGLQMALADMQVGGKRIAILPPELAFGERGVPSGFPPKIPPNATLIFEMELLDVKGN